jgi:hypothetical protein
MKQAVLGLIVGLCGAGCTPSPGSVTVHVESDGTVLVVSDRYGRYVRHSGVVFSGSYTLDEVPHDAMVSRVVVRELSTSYPASYSGPGCDAAGCAATIRRGVEVDTVAGVRAGDVLWLASERESYSDRLGKFELGPLPPLELAHDTVRAYGADDDGWLVRSDLEPVHTLYPSDLNPAGRLDLWVEARQDGQPVATGFSSGNKLRGGDGHQQAWAAIETWNTTPTTLELSYTNTTEAEESYHLSLWGQRDLQVYGGTWKDARFNDWLAPGARIAVVSAFDDGFHERVGLRVGRWARFGASGSEGDPLQGGHSALFLRRPVPAPGTHGTIALTAADFAAPFPVVDWEPTTRTVSPDWTGVSCGDVPFVLLKAELVWSLEGDEPSLHWTVAAAAPGPVVFPQLDPASEAIVQQQLAEPLGLWMEGRYQSVLWRRTVSVLGLAVPPPRGSSWASWASAFQADPSSLSSGGDRQCLVVRYFGVP